MLIGWIGLAIAQPPLAQALEQTEATWNEAWNETDAVKLEAVLSPSFGTLRTSAADLRKLFEDPDEHPDSLQELRELHTTDACGLAVVVEVDERHAEGLYRCPRGWKRIQYDRADDETLEWRRSIEIRSVRDPRGDNFLSGPIRYSWHQVEVDSIGWTHYRSAGAVGVRISARATDGPCPPEVAIAAADNRRWGAGLQVSLSEDLGVRSTRDSCMVLERSAEPAAEPCEPCRHEEAIRMVSLAERLRWVEPAVAGELARAVLRRAPASADALYQIAELGRRPDEARVPAGGDIVVEDGRVAFLDKGPITVVDGKILKAELLVRGTRDAPQVWGARDLDQRRFALNVPVDVAASAAEDWLVTELGLEDVEAEVLEGSVLQLVQKRELLVEVRPWGAGSLIRFAPLGPLPSPDRTSLFRAVLSPPPEPQLAASFVLPPGGKAVPPLWPCARREGCLTGATIVAKGARVDVPDAWMPSLEECWKDTDAVDELLLPELTLRVKSRLGAGVVDFAGDAARSDGRVYTASCVLPQGQRLQTWYRMHLAWRALAIAGKDTGDVEDAWGRPVRIEGTGPDSTFVSLGADGQPGGEGLDADLRYPPAEE